MKRHIPIILSLLVLYSGAARGSSLWVKADVAQAEVFLDGVSVGRTPLAIASIAAGQHKVRLVHEGFQEASRDVEIPETGLTRIFITMEPVAPTPPVLPVTVPAWHQHKTTTCTGKLTIAEDGLHFEANDKQDVFNIPWKSITILTRGMGSAPDVQWDLPGEACGLRVDTQDRNYGFLIYEETPELAKLSPAQIKKNQILLAAKPTEKIFRLAWQIWLPMFKASAPQAAPGTAAK